GEGGTEGRRRGRDRWGWGICRCAARRRHIFTSRRRCLSTACCLQASSLFRRHLKKGDHDPSANPHPMKRASLVPRCCFWLSCLFWGRSSYASVGPFSTPRLVDLVMEELREELTMLLNNELAEDRLEKQVLQKGMLLEFWKDSERIFLAVAQKPNGKKNWMVYDLDEVYFTIKESKGFSSVYQPRPIALALVVILRHTHHQHDRWQARIGRVAENKDLYLGTFIWNYMQNTGMGGRTRASQGLVASRFAFSLPFWCIDRGWLVVVAV
ncbi:hypothetical protein Taro_040304, partial [Colocasia esculenta]|nr:hypothetical protein [Colocasia esculenta]